jgi:hypothetical protein
MWLLGCGQLITRPSNDRYGARYGRHGSALRRIDGHAALCYTGASFIERDMHALESRHNMLEFFARRNAGRRT